MTIVIDRDGLFGGDRLRRCSNMAQLHFTRLLVASNGFGRLEINYARIVGTAYVGFNPAPSETELQSWIREYVENSLLFLYEAGGRLWGQWDINPKFLPRFKTAADRRSPTPPEPQLTDWKILYRTEIKAFQKYFGKISEIFPSVVVGVGVGVGVVVEKPKTCASQTDARGGELLSIEPPKPSKEPQEQERWFASWWLEYWLKKAKKDAWKAFQKHVKTEERFRVVMAATRAQKAEMLEREPAKRPHAATWLNGERWEDELQSQASADLPPPKIWDEPDDGPPAPPLPIDMPALRRKPG